MSGGGGGGGGGGGATFAIIVICRGVWLNNGIAHYRILASKHRIIQDYSSLFQSKYYSAVTHAHLQISCASNAVEDESKLVLHSVP